MRRRRLGFSGPNWLQCLRYILHAHVRDGGAPEDWIHVSIERTRPQFSVLGIFPTGRFDVDVLFGHLLERLSALGCKLLGTLQLIAMLDRVKTARMKFASRLRLLSSKAKTDISYLTQTHLSLPAREAIAEQPTFRDFAGSLVGLHLKIQIRSVCISPGRTVSPNKFVVESPHHESPLPMHLPTSEVVSSIWWRRPEIAKKWRFTKEKYRWL
jgi:hypothetical protein